MLDQESDALTRMGFRRSGSAFRLLWSTGSQTHVITISELEKGWAFVWQRGVTYTIAEETTKTFEEVVAMLWRHVFRIAEHTTELIGYQAQHKVHGSAIYGAVIRQLARGDFLEGPAVSPPRAFERAISLGDEQGKAVKIAMAELGPDRAAEIYDKEWEQLVARNCHPPE